MLKEIDPRDIRENAFKLIGDDWMLVTAGDIESFNTMTASWGLLGELWGLHVAEAVVRPQRYTHNFIEKTGKFTLSFFKPEMKKILGVMGTKSGSEIDKMHYPGLDALVLPSGQITFKQAWLTLECEVVYADNYTVEAFKDTSILDKWYDNDLHTRYIGNILHAWIAD